MSVKEKSVPAKKAEDRWHRHPVFVGGVVALLTALIGIVSTLIAGKTGNLPEALSPTPSFTTVTIPGPTTTVAGPTVTTTTTATVTITPVGTIDTAAPPVAAKLTALTSNDGWEDGPLELNGSPYGDSVRSGLSTCRQTKTSTWRMSRDYAKLTTTVGLTDDSAPDLRVQFRAYVDGRSVLTPVNLTKGTTRKLEIPLNKGLDLKLEIAMIAGNKNTCSIQGYGVWADPTVYP
ncbi:NPCBM/NEW2 domain-containing protein [Kribbella sp. NBC_01245]|uniref:NPCBM/NEW2 domain-containing protein n=1 Tax=Kribbella sp. NBC_01245 TaxID=2903578 RepID=UPI002E2B9B64|nr:NPCBM/NEW2 domain-containing protein [Kribbella sp. NBC_01245]